MLRILTRLTAIILLLSVSCSAISITYQGHLRNQGALVNGPMDMEFSLWNAESNGNKLSLVLPYNNVDVVNGLFSVKLNFGSTATTAALFNGDPRWLQMAIRPSGSGDPFETISPRHEMTYVPYAVHTLNDSPWTLSGVDIYYNAGEVGIGITSPTSPLHIREDAGNNWLSLQESGGTKWNVTHRSSPGSGVDSALQIASDNSPLKLLLPDESGGMRMYLWDSSRAVPNMPHTGVKPTFALWGDMLIGDIVCIERNPMSMFFRSETNLSASSPVIFFCANKGINTDTDGGAGIILHPDHHQDLVYHPNDPVNHSESGSLQLIAYGNGSGTYANTIRLQTRNGPGSLATVMVVENGHVQIYGTLNATGGFSSSRKLKNSIKALAVDDALALVKQLKTVTYKYNSDPDGHDRIGFIAEEVPEIFTTPERKGVDYMGVAAMLTQVVQEQQKQIDALQQQLSKVQDLVEKSDNQFIN